jgi:putative transposase
MAATKGGQEIPRGKQEQAEQIIPKLREVEVEFGRGKTVTEAAKKIGLTEQTYYRWKKRFGGLRIDQAKRLKELEKENSRLKRLLPDAELDKAILREAASGCRRRAQLNF